MTTERLLEKLKAGENLVSEFKRCGNGIHDDVYETVCAFLNRFGGDIFLGVEDDGSVCGVPEKAVKDLIRNFLNKLNSPELFSPVCTATIEPVQVEGKTVLWVMVPKTSLVHRFKGKVYDRAGDSDIVVSSTEQLAAMYIRKQEIFTERRVYSHIKMEHLRPDLIRRARRMAENRWEKHPWTDMDDMQLVRSAGLYAHDFANDTDGFTLAAVLLLGRDEVIRDVLPAYRTDAICRRTNTDRYDDRDVVETNLIESYDRLMDFARKHIADKFYLDRSMVRISLSHSICREMISNILMHREFSSSRLSRFVIEREQMYTENPNKAQYPNEITLENLEPLPKNPCIARFFRSIGYAEELGSGVHHLYEYVPLYSGEEMRPRFVDGDMFKIIVPLDDALEVHATENSFADASGGNVGASGGNVGVSGGNVGVNRKDVGVNDSTYTENERRLLNLVAEQDSVSAAKAADRLGLTTRQTERLFASLKKKGAVIRVGADRGGHWEIQQNKKQ